MIVTDKSQNLRRLEAQRNELNAKGKLSIDVRWIMGRFIIGREVLELSSFR